MTLTNLGCLAQKERFGGELFPDWTESESGLRFAEFFQRTVAALAQIEDLAIEVEEYEQLRSGEQYEANGYATASLVRLCEIAEALGLKISETAKLSTTSAA